MHKFAALGLLLGAGLLVTIGVAGASDSGADALPADAASVDYEWAGDTGMVSIEGEPGAQYEVYDSMGRIVGGGVLDAPHVSFVTGHSGVGPDGTIVFIRVDDEIVAVTDPEWEWN